MLKKCFSKFAGLWLVGEVVNHAGLYGSKVAEGSAFQRRSCLMLAVKLACYSLNISLSVTRCFRCHRRQDWPKQHGLQCHYLVLNKWLQLNQMKRVIQYTKFKIICRCFHYSVMYVCSGTLMWCGRVINSHGRVIKFSQCELWESYWMSTQVFLCQYIIWH